MDLAWKVLGLLAATAALNLGAHLAVERLRATWRQRRRNRGDLSRAER